MNIEYRCGNPSNVIYGHASGYVSIVIWTGIMKTAQEGGVVLYQIGAKNLNLLFWSPFPILHNVV